MKGNLLWKGLGAETLFLGFAITGALLIPIYFYIRNYKIKNKMKKFRKE